MGRKKKEPDKLAQDAAAALAAGMTYGKWKAMQDQPVVIEKKETEIPDGWITCKRCGKPFKPYSKKQLYCEAGCQKEAQSERDRGKYKEYYRSYMEKKRAEAAE